MRLDASSSRTMLVVLLVLVSVVSGNVNLTSSERLLGGSRMAWMKALFEHHGWLDAINDANVTLQSQCSDHLKTYRDALQDGKLWASKSEWSCLFHNTKQVVLCVNLCSQRYFMRISFKECRGTLFTSTSHLILNNVTYILLYYCCTCKVTCRYYIILQAFRVNKQIIRAVA